MQGKFLDNIVQVFCNVLKIVNSYIMTKFNSVAAYTNNNIIPENLLQEIAADLRIIAPYSSETSQWAVTPRKLLLFEPHKSAVKHTELATPNSFFKFSLRSKLN